MFICIRLNKIREPLKHVTPGFSVHGILHTRILEWVAMPFSRVIFLIQEQNLCLFCLLHWKTDPLPLAAAAAKSIQQCPALCEPIDGSPPGSSVPGILEARTLEWAAISLHLATWKTNFSYLIFYLIYKIKWLCTNLLFHIVTICYCSVHSLRRKYLQEKQNSSPK